MIEIIQGDCIKCMKQVPSNRVDMVVTSPPYWGLRSYEGSETIWGGDENCNHKWGKEQPRGGRGKRSQDFDPKFAKDNNPYEDKRGSNFCSICGAWKGQLGLEPTPDLYITHLVEIFGEVKRILKKSGSFYLNLGDTYCSSTKEAGRHDTNSKTSTDFGGWSNWDGGITKIGKIEKSNWLTPKQLLLIPSRVAIALQDEGFILRNDNIWYKKNPMPSSVKDRRNNTFEHVFHFVKSKKYYFDLDTIRVPHKTRENRPFGIVRNREYGYDSKLNKIRGLKSGNPKGKNPGDVIVPISWGVDKNQEYHGDGKHNPKGQSPSDLKKNIIESYKNNPEGKNPGDVLTVNTQPFPEAHFAVFPEKLVEPLIMASCPRWVCKKCEQPKKQVIKVPPNPDAFNIRVRDVKEGRIKFEDRKASETEVSQYQEEEYQSQSREIVIAKGCKCNAGFKPGIVLDPFSGAGTTAVVAKKLYRNFIGFEISKEYIDITNKRLKRTLVCRSLFDM